MQVTFAGRKRRWDDRRKIGHLDALISLLRRHALYEKKIACLDRLEEVQRGFTRLPTPWLSMLLEFPIHGEYVIKAIFAIWQEKCLFDIPVNFTPLTPRFRKFIEGLIEVEEHYFDIGGIIGYQRSVLYLLSQKKRERRASICPTLHRPKSIDLAKDCEQVRRAVVEGIRAQGKMGEFYPIGGIGERLQLQDKRSGEELPTATLLFLGKSLLVRMIEDLQAREYLRFQLFGKADITPIIMMVSKGQGRFEHIQKICETNRWFGRPKGSFHFLIQPAVPAFTRSGDWCLEQPLQLLAKPGGHGAIWKLAEKAGVLEWLRRSGKKAVLARQINNPIVGIDYGLISFQGIGHRFGKSFGFFSCPHQYKTHEGINAIKKIAGGDRWVMTSIEYCDFEKFGMRGRPLPFPSNTNLLFVSLDAMEHLVAKIPHPGLLINFKKGRHFSSGKMRNAWVARLESSMQNLAEGVEWSADQPVYLTLNTREKSISAIKKRGDVEGSGVETSKECYCDMIQNARELFEKYCHVHLPPFSDREMWIKNGPPFLLVYHPALGPLYSIIGQKIHNGTLAHGAEMQLHIADIALRDFRLEGSLIVHAEKVTGYEMGGKKPLYSHRTGQCLLKDVRIVNAGVDWNKNPSCWEEKIERKACLKISLKGHSLFIAKDVTFTGEWSIEVPAGICMVVQERRGKLIFTKTRLTDCRPFWTYSVDSDASIRLSQRIDRAT